MAGTLVIDGRNALDREAVAAAGLTYEGIGARSDLERRAGVILVGGEGTRLRPLTSTVPKPVVPLVDRPFMVYMLEWLRGHGVDDVIMSCGFLATKVRDVLGDGSALRHRAALRRGARAARHRRRAEVRRGAPRRALPDAQRRRAHRPRPVRPDRPARAHAARRGTLALVPVDGPERLRPRAARRGRRGARSSSRSPRPTSSTPNLISRRRLRARALGARPHRARPQRLDRARDLARARRRRASTASPTDDAYWLDIGTPERYLQGDVRHPRGQRPHRRRRRWARLPVVDAARGRGRAGRRDRRRGARSPPARTSALAVLGETSRRRGLVVERAVVLEGAEVGAGCVLRDCIVGAGARIGDAASVVRAARCSARASRSAPTTSLDDGAKVAPGVPPAIGADAMAARCSMTTTETARSTAEAIAAVDALRPARPTSSRMPEHLRDALWKVESADLRAVGQPGRPRRRRHGRLGDRRRAGARALGDHASRPIARVARTTACRLDDARHDGPVRLLLGRHRGDARLLRGGRRARRAARRGHERRPAGRAGARRRRAGHPGRRRLPAARRGRLHDRRRARGRRRCAAPGRGWAPRSTSPPTTSRQLVVEWGPDGAEDCEAKALARALHGSVPVIAGAGLDRRRSPTAGRPSSTRTPRSRRSRTSCPSSTTTRSSAGTGAPTLGRFGAVFLDDCDTHPRVQASASS